MPKYRINKTTHLHPQLPVRQRGRRDLQRSTAIRGHKCREANAANQMLRIKSCESNPGRRAAGVPGRRDSADSGLRGGLRGWLVRWPASRMDTNAGCARRPRF